MERRDISSGPSAHSLAELKEYYKHSEGYRAHLEAKGPAYFQQFVHVVCECSGPEDRILDIGCGTGESTREILQRNRRVIGTDLSRLFIHHDKGASSNPSFVTSDASKLPFPDRSFDVVCAMEFIEHVWPVDLVLNEIDRVLKPSGRVVLVSPNLLSPLWPVRDLPSMLIHRRFRPPFYSSYGEAASFLLRSSWLTAKKMLSQEPHFVPREPDLKRADGGGDYDSVYSSNGQDIKIFLEKRGYRVCFALGSHSDKPMLARRTLAKVMGSVWTSFLLRGTKPST